MAKEKQSMNNFGIGWGTILYCLLMFFLYVGMINDGTNVLAPAAAANCGVEPGTIITMNGYAGMIAVIGFIIAGQINKKIGPRLTSAICLIISGVTYIGCGNATSVMFYTVCMTLCATGMMSAGYVAGGTLVANWFPKKKGIVMGYTTMGHNFASAFYVAIMTGLIATMGSMNKASWLPGVAAIILGIVGFIFMRNTPQERGINPDNVSDEVYASEYDTAEDDSDWTTIKLLKTKETWFAAIFTGLFQICSVGVMQQLVTRNIRDFGMTQGAALTLMTIVALIGVFGSWIIGVIDQKIGTKKTMQFFGIWYAAALVINVLAKGQVGLLFYLSILMIGMGIGGSANFTTSLPTSIFGRQGFDKVNSVVFPIQGFVTAWCFVVNGIVTNVIGNLSVAYIIFAVGAVIVSVCVTFVDEYKYNKDHKAELK
ncbi:MFS transporter [Coprococcus catus]|uniref:MFS transporter n=1 Tax=Coprococcus catus TaxID=116085 RepID=UPI001C8C59DC|nr:MFS transporter [Coprococcus catus]MBX9230151.1 OFA family MFS transporter [Coprococcus catus]MCT6798795.1 MFS transporter [Coprococcus catus]